MRVLQIMECTIGGTRRHLRELVHGLADRGVDVEVACSTLREPAMAGDLAAMRAAGVTVHRIPMVRAIRPVRDTWHALRLAGLMAGRRFDIVHTHSSKAGALGRAAAILCSRARRVHTPHTFAFSFEGGRGQGGEPAGPPGLVLAVERFLGRRTHRFIHVSSSEREQGQQLAVVAPERAAVVHNGIQAAQYATPRGGGALRRELGIPAGAPVVGSVGLLNDAKGYDVLVEAFAQLPPEAHLLIAGDGERRGALLDRARRLGVASRLHLPGWQQAVQPTHDATDVFVLPSRWEGLAYSLLEAMAAGLPCISSDVNGSREALGLRAGEPACGVLVPPGDPVALAGAVRALLEDAPRRRALGRAAARRVAVTFTLEGMVEGVLAVYHELTGRS